MRTARVYLIVLMTGVAAILGLKWYVERDTEPILGLEELAQPEFIKTHPEKTRRAASDLLNEALDARASGEEADESFEKACRLARAIEQHLDDPSVDGACRFYGSLDRSGAGTKRDADRLTDESEAAYLSGKRSDASELADRALVLYKKIGDRWGELRVMNLLGNIHWVSGERDEAIAQYHRLLDGAKEIGDRNREAAAVNNLARIEEWRGNIREAESGYRRVGELGDRHGLARIRGFALLYRGNLLHRLGIPERAADVLQQSADIFHDLDEGQFEAAAATNRGASLQRMGLHDEAFEAYRRSLALRSQSENPSGRIGTLLQIAELHYEGGDAERATESLNEILSLTEEATDAASRSFRWGALITATDIDLASGRLEAARRSLEEAQGIAEEVGHTLYGVELDRRRAELFRLEDDPEKAAGVLENAVAVIERLRTSPEAEEDRVGFLEAQDSVFKDLAGIYLRRLNRPEDAFEILEKGRSRAFLDSLEGGAFIASDSSGAPRVLLGASAETTDLDQVVSILPAKAALLHYTVTPKWLAVMIADSGGNRSHVVVDIAQEELESLATSFVQQTSGEPAGEQGPTVLGEKLSHLLLDPLIALQSEQETLVIVPDGILFSIPWAALPFRQGYLIDEHVISIEPSASVFVHLAGRAPRPREPSALLVANPSGGPVVGGIRPRPLPEAEKEARELEQILSQTTSLVGRGASEEAVRAETGLHDILHFGTHAWIVSESPLRSSLLLAGSDGQVADPQLVPVAPRDGVLTGYEVLGLEMRPQAMVTLAACESVGKGRRRGEGVAGLARAFFEAGAGTVIASLWPVEDRATRELMVHFYRGLATEGKSAASALAEAQSELLKGGAGERRRHAYYWAGFVLIGDGR